MQVGESLSAPNLKRKKPAAPYSRTGESRTTLGEGALNFRVRNGNGCDNSSMATGKSRKLDAKENRNISSANRISH